MTYDLEILKELFLPALEEMSSHSSVLADDMSRGEVFWSEFNKGLLGTQGELLQILDHYKVWDIWQYAEQYDSLKAEYIGRLAQSYCLGNISPTAMRLFEQSDAAFMEQVAFQKDMLAAITLAGRSAMRSELKLSDEFPGANISDEEIAHAFSVLQRDATRNDIRKQLNQLDEEQPQAPKAVKRKRVGIVPLLLFRLAAAAAVGTVVTIEVVHVYNERSKPAAAVAKANKGIDSNRLAGNSAATDEAGKTDSLRPKVGLTTHVPDTTKAKAANLHIILKGSAVDTASNELVTDVTITMVV